MRYCGNNRFHSEILEPFSGKSWHPLRKFKCTEKLIMIMDASTIQLVWYKQHPAFENCLVSLFWGGRGEGWVKPLWVKWPVHGKFLPKKFEEKLILVWRISPFPSLYATIVIDLIWNSVHHDIMIIKYHDGIVKSVRNENRHIGKKGVSCQQGQQHDFQQVFQLCLYI